MFCKILNLRFIHCSLYCIDLSASQFKFWYDVCHLFSNKELIKSWTLSLCHLKIVLFKLFHFLFGCWMVAGVLLILRIPLLLKFERHTHAHLYWILSRQAGWSDYMDSVHPIYRDLSFESQLVWSNKHQVKIIKIFHITEIPVSEISFLVGKVFSRINTLLLKKWFHQKVAVAQYFVYVAN